MTHPRYLHVPGRLTGRGFLKELETALYRRALRSEVADFRATEGRKVILVHSGATAGYALLPLIDRVPLVVSVHDSDIHRATLYPRVRDVVSRVLAAATHAVYPSSTLEGRAHDLVGRHDSSVIPWGVETYPEVVRSEPAVFTVCSVSRLIETKGLDLLVEAFSKLLSTHSESRLVIVGRGPFRPRLEELVRTRGIEARVSLTGWLTNRDAREQVSRASAFVLPSYVEALGVAYLEAMSLGVPVVGVEGEGITDVLVDGRNGLLVPPRDVDALLQAMLRLARDPEGARRLGDEGKRTFDRGGYDWSGNAARYAALFERLVG